LTRFRADEIGIPPEFLLPAIGRTRDVFGDTLTAARLRELDERGRPTMLFSPDGRPLEQYPAAVRDYLEQGVALDLPKRPLIATRRPWYRMEKRSAPPFLFAYLGRRDARFIRNLAGAVPLTGFLCVYPRRTDDDFIERLWQVLRRPETIRNLRLVGKSYGGGAIKVEPRALERLPIDDSVLASVGPACGYTGDCGVDGAAP
jgi:hypothetical protein